MNQYSKRLILQTLLGESLLPNDAGRAHGVAQIVLRAFVRRMIAGQTPAFY